MASQQIFFDASIPLNITVLRISVGVLIQYTIKLSSKYFKYVYRYSYRVYNFIVEEDFSLTVNSFKKENTKQKLIKCLLVSIITNFLFISPFGSS